MTVAKLMGQSAILTVLGLGVVFAFLTITVFSVELTARLLKALGLDGEPAASAVGIGSAPATEARKRAAIAAALHKHIGRHDA